MKILRYVEIVSEQLYKEIKFDLVVNSIKDIIVVNEHIIFNGCLILYF